MGIWLIALMAALAALWVWWRMRRKEEGRTNADDKEDRVDTLIGWPPQATRVMTAAERIAFGTLTRALPDYMVLAQVPLSRFLAVPKRHSYSDWLRRLGYQSVDFVICDMTSQVIAVIEIGNPDRSETDRARKRIKRIRRSLAAAHVPLIVWAENELPTVDAAREAVLPRSAATGFDAMGDSALTGPAAMALESAADLTLEQDPEIPPEDRVQPPPSTWFDDLDSAPVPLRKN